jgi:hypothetical protein
MNGERIMETWDQFEHDQRIHNLMLLAPSCSPEDRGRLARALDAELARCETFGCFAPLPRRGHDER